MRTTDVSGKYFHFWECLMNKEKNPEKAPESFVYLTSNQG